MALKPTDDDFDEQMNLASDQIDKGGSRWPGMSYEEGVRAALMWAMGDSEEVPMPDE